ncbi:MAG: primosomal protein DnaI [Bacilli bacterium]|nr:primosomal protein DnaI [Bacilli bacterium]
MTKITDIYKTDLTALTHSYQDACANKEFHKFVTGLNVKDDTLMKYTSSLEEAFSEHKNCQKCKGLTACKNKVSGYCYTPVPAENVITFSYDACGYLQEELERNAYKDNLDLFDMPKEIKNASFKEIYKDDKARVPIIKYFKEFMDNYQNEKKPKGIYLNGSFGSGKTYLIASLFNEMAKKGEKSILIYYPEFLRSLKASFQTNYTEQFNYIKKIPLLLLDDIGAENCSNWSRDEVLGPILQYRMENCLPTFFTSNLNLEELEKHLGITSSGVDKVKARRIIERIKQLTIYQELISKNRRD